jgi:biotin carboxyl carrier protein
VKLDIEIAGKTHRVDLTAAAETGRWTVQLDGQPVEADAHLIRPGVLSLLLEGRAYRIVLDADLQEPALHLDEHRIEWQADDPRSFQRRRRHAAAHGPVTIKASMPGRVVRILVQRGEAVAAHQGVLVMEAMKMQNELKSPKEGRVTDLRVIAGDTVAAGQVLAVIE